MIEFQNLNKNYSNIDPEKIIDAIELVLREEYSGEEPEISIVIISSEEMQEINNRYRKKDKPTDVLSFGTLKDYFSERDFILPEIIICPEEVFINSKECQESFEDSMIKVAIHGTLHLLGLDHEKSSEEEKEMFEKQDAYFLKYLNKK